MSVFYDEASLVLVPSGYKASKVYAQKPLTADGQLTFSRASTATRVGPDGLIEKVRTNLALYSEQLNNAYWIKAGSPAITVTANAGTAPDGTTTADRCLATSVGTSSRVYTDVTWGGGEHTLSLYVKNNGGTNTSFRLSYYDSVDQYFSPTFILTNEWQRITFTFSPAAGAGGFWLVNTNIASGDLDLLAWGAQLETGVATDYIATTSAPVTVGRLANVPRLDYTNSTCPKLLLEPQRSNLYTFSEQTDNAAWGKTNTTVTANSTTSPDGTANADKVVANTTNGVHRIEQDRATAAQVATQSVFAKASGYNFIALENGGELAYFNISTGVVGSVSGGTASIQNYGNGWYRCIFTATAANTKSYVYIANANNSASFAGDNTSGAFIYGAQFEAGAYATSYIPTTTAAVTRLADAASKTGISSLIGQTEGTIFWEGQISSTQNGQLCDLNADGNKFIQIYNTLSGSTPAIGVYIQNVSVLLNTGSIATIAFNTNFKFALGYKNNDYVAYLNGVQVYVNTATAVPPTSNFGIGRLEQTAEIAGKSINQALLFKTRLTNAQLAELTTL